jgi:hypothetical protein
VDLYKIYENKINRNTKSTLAGGKLFKKRGARIELGPVDADEPTNAN